jgi:hypothetical protein
MQKLDFRQYDQGQNDDALGEAWVIYVLDGDWFVQKWLDAPLKKRRPKNGQTFSYCAK